MLHMSLDASHEAFACRPGGAHPGIKFWQGFKIIILIFIIIIITITVVIIIIVITGIIIIIIMIIIISLSLFLFKPVPSSRTAATPAKGGSLMHVSAGGLHRGN